MAAIARGRRALAEREQLLARIAELELELEQRDQPEGTAPAVQGRRATRGRK